MVKVRITSSGFWDVSEIKLEFLNAKFLSVFFGYYWILSFLLLILKKSVHI